MPKDTEIATSNYTTPLCLTFSLCFCNLFCTECAVKFSIWAEERNWVRCTWSIDFLWWHDRFLLDVTGCSLQSCHHIHLHSHWLTLTVWVWTKESEPPDCQIFHFLARLIFLLCHSITNMKVISAIFKETHRWGEKEKVWG